MEPEQVKQLQLTITKDQFKFRSLSGKETAIALVGKESHEGRFRLNPGSKPKAIDILPATGPQQNKVLPGIYQLENDNALTLCWREEGKERPTQFATKPKEDIVLLVLKREKP
jgi:uncharacterized protein (TIGR03067 family)